MVRHNGTKIETSLREAIRDETNSNDRLMISCISQVAGVLIVK